MLSSEKLSLLKKCLKNNHGFTFLEILISLFLFSLLSMVLWSGLSSAQGLIGKIFQEASHSAKILQLDDFVREAALKVKIPFWVKEIEIEAEDDRLAIPWLDGDSEDFLVFRKQNNRIMISYQNSGQLLSFGPFADINVELQEYENGLIWGVKLTIPASSNADYKTVISAQFGSAPLSIMGSK